MNRLASANVLDIVRPPAGQATELTVTFTPSPRVKKRERYALALQGIGGAVASVLTNRPSGQATPNCPTTLFDFANNMFSKDTCTDIVFTTVVTKG